MEWLQKILSKIAGGKTVEEIQTEIQVELPKHFKPAADFNEKLEKIKTLETEIETAKTTQTNIQTEYDNFKKGSMTQADYEAKVKTIQDNAKVELDKAKLESKIDVALIGASARNTKAIKALLNLDNVKLDGDNLLGFNEQVESLKKSDAYLFDIKESKNEGAGSNNNYEKVDGDKIDTSNMSYEQVCKYLEQNPDAEI